MREVADLLTAWNSFYVVMGSSAAALTGLMFVVITLVKDNQRTPSHDGLATFSTPTVAHFCCALFASALMLTPFRSLVPIAMLLGLAGAGRALKPSDPLPAGDAARPQKARSFRRTAFSGACGPGSAV